MVNISKYEVNIRKLRWNCNPKEFEFKDTSQLKEPGRLEDIIKGQEIAKKQLKDAIRLRQNAILVGPPGCGKTLIAKEIARSINCYFKAINGAELMSRYVGEAEKEFNSKMAEKLRKKAGPGTRRAAGSQPLPGDGGRQGAIDSRDTGKVSPIPVVQVWQRGSAKYR